MPHLGPLHCQHGDSRFFTILENMANLHARKSADYGSGEDPLTNLRNAEEFGVANWIGCMIRANDKMRRIKTMACVSKLHCESLEDSLLDLANYSVLALILFREQQQKATKAKVPEIVCSGPLITSSGSVGSTGYVPKTWNPASD